MKREKREAIEKVLKYYFSKPDFRLAIYKNWIELIRAEMNKGVANG